MPVPQNFYAFVGASVVGIVCAATVFIVEHMRQEKRRHGMAKDLAKLNTEMSVVRKELDQLLLAQQKDKPKLKNRKSRKANSVISTSSTTDEFMSAADLDSSDLEFYDVSDNDDDDDADNDNDNDGPLPTLLLEMALGEVDKKIEEGTVEDLEEALKRLLNLNNEHIDNPNILWLIGKTNYKLSEKTQDKNTKLEYVKSGIEACESAIDLPPKLANVHKWLAVLIGVRIDYLSLKDKLNDSRIFKEHLDIAISLDSNDPVLYHMLSQFIYQFASLRWYEKRIAATIYPEAFNASYIEALEYSLKAEDLSTTNDWKENKLLVAKCKIGLNDLIEAVKWLEEANQITTNNGVDEKIEKEIKELLAKYRSDNNST